jgi:hypothetical protein
MKNIKRSLIDETNLRNENCDRRDIHGKNEDPTGNIASTFDLSRGSRIIQLSTLYQLLYSSLSIRVPLRLIDSSKTQKAHGAKQNTIITMTPHRRAARSYGSSY